MASINMKQTDPTAWLEEYRGKDFGGTWPTMKEMFDLTVKRYPTNNCFTDFDGPNGARRTLSYAQVKEKVVALAAWLTVNGVAYGDKVAVSGKNSPEWAVVYLSAFYAGATIVPIDYGLHNEEIDNLLNTAEPKFFFVDSEKYDYFSQKKAKYQVYSLAPEPADKYVYNLTTDKTPEVTYPKEDDIAAILFTSGTTGTPKGVMLTHKNLVSDTYLAQTNMNIYSTDVFYALLPIHHAYTMTAVFIEAISVGAEVVFGKTMAVSRMMKELREGKITMLLGVPLLFNKLLAGIMKGIKEKGAFVYGIIKFLMGLSYIIKKLTKCNPGKALFKSVLKKANIYTLRIAICGGGPLAPSVFKAYNELGIDFVQGYGLTETSPIVALNPVYAFKIESVGKNLRDVEFKVIDADENGVGELCIKGPMVMKGYYNMPEETAATFTEDGWFKTGDLGWIDREGYVMLSGRAKNMIVTAGGKNVYPEEIENAFQLYDELEQITIQGYIPEGQGAGEEIEALIYPADSMLTRIGADRKNPADADRIQKEASSIVDEVNKNLLSYQRISKVTILPEPLEMTTTKKVKRIYKK
jgi:long-chain acyl-CoA synthetase